MATVNLGAIKFNWKGAYVGSTSYAVDDVVSSGGSSYVCILASTGNAVSNGTYWNIMSSAGTNGTNGTDVGTTLTTQGDILYRDGSGLQRLAKGTANQELRINSGATAPEWHTPAVASSDYVKLASISATSGAIVSINGYFNDTIYAMYKLIIYNSEASTNEWWKCRFNISNTDFSGNYYRWTGFYNRRSNSTNSSASDGAWDNNYLPINWWGPNVTSDTNISEITITEPQSTSQGKGFLCSNASQDNGNQTRFDVAGALTSQTATTGISIFPNGGTILRLNATLYGVKK